MEDVQAQVDLGPRPAGSEANERQSRLIARRLRQAGVEDVRVQKPHRNVVGTIPGRARGSVVVGAHHDTFDIPDFVGANDGASGVAIVLELARSLPAKVDGPDLRLALFDAEEAPPGADFSAEGTRGSRQYVRYAARDKRRQGSPPLREHRGDGALRHGRRLRPRAAARDELRRRALRGLRRRLRAGRRRRRPLRGDREPRLRRPRPLPRAGDPRPRPDRLRLRLRRHPGLLLAHAPGHGRQGVRGEPRRGGRGRGARPAGAASSRRYP